VETQCRRSYFLITVLALNAAGPKAHALQFAFILHKYNQFDKVKLKQLCFYFKDEKKVAGEVLKRQNVKLNANIYTNEFAIWIKGLLMTPGFESEKLPSAGSVDPGTSLPYWSALPFAGL